MPNDDEGSTQEHRFVLDQLHRMYNGDAWHGPSLSDAVIGVTAEQAAARIAPHAHTIYELTHHVAAWIGEVQKRLRGGEPTMPADGDFPSADTAVTEASWGEALQRLGDRHRALFTDVEAFDAARLHDHVRSRGAPGEATLTYLGLLHGLVQHNAYHAGQIMLIRRALG